MPRLPYAIVTTLAFSLMLSACSTLREGLGKAEQIIAANEKGQLIQANAPTEGQPTVVANASAVRGGNVADITKAARSLPGGLGGDTANQIYIGDAIPPK